MFIEKVFVRMFAVLLVSMSAIEIAAYKWRFIGKPGLVLWLAIGAIMLFEALRLVVRNVSKDLAHKDIAAILVLAIWGLITFFGIGDPLLTSVNHESTQQVGAALQALATDSSWGFHGRSFLNYPTRQYLVNALPTLAFGTGFNTLRLGYALPFFLALLMLYVAIRIWEGRQRPSLSPLVLLALLCSPFLVLNLRTYEQVLNSFSFGTIAASWFFIYFSTKSRLHLLFLTWSIGLLCYSYTPSLAMAAFLVLGLLTLTFKPAFQKHNMLILLSAAYASVCFVVSYLSLSSAIVVGTGSDVQMTASSQIERAMSLLFSPAFPNFLGFGLGVLALIYFLVAFTGKTNSVHLAITVWCIDTIIIAVLLKGYVLRTPDVSLHRALVILPILYFGIFLFFRNVLLNKRKLRILIFLFLTISSAYNLYESKHILPLAPKPTVHDLVLKELTETYNEVSSPIKICLPVTTYDLINFGDYSKYFFPKSVVSHFDNGKMNLDCNTGTLGTVTYFNAVLYKFYSEDKGMKGIEFRFSHGGDNYYRRIYP